MAQNYHMGANGPGKCDAKPGNCPLKDEEGNPVAHGSHAEMQAAFEKKLETEHGQFTSFSKDIPGFPDLAEMQNILTPTADDTYTVEPGTYVGFCGEGTNYVDVDVLSDIEHSHGNESFIATEINGGKIYIETEASTGVTNYLVSQELFNELADRGLEFTDDYEPEVITIEENTKISKTVQDEYDDAWLEPTVKGSTSILKLNGTYDLAKEND